MKKKDNGVKRAAEKGSIWEIEDNQESYKSENKESKKERKSITIEEYKQKVKTIDSLHKILIIVSIVVMFYQTSCLDMNTSYPFTAQESTYDINCNYTYPIQAQANSNLFNLDAELQRAVNSIQPTKYGPCIQYGSR